MTVNVINPSSTNNIVFICEHASNQIPAEFNKLGMDDKQLQLHIAWDIGICEVTKKLAQALNATAVIAEFSRLLIDANRAIDQVGLIPEISDKIKIPGNQNLSQKDINYRIENFYKPFHQVTNDIVQQKSTFSKTPIILNMHSFTPKMNGIKRQWHSGMLWNKDPRVANALMKNLILRGLSVGDNQPYSGRELNHTMNTHGTQYGYPHVNIEIRQDEIDHPQGILKWCAILSHEIRAIRNLPEMAYIKHY